MILGTPSKSEINDHMRKMLMEPGNAVAIGSSITNNVVMTPKIQEEDMDKAKKIQKKNANAPSFTSEREFYGAGGHQSDNQARRNSGDSSEISLPDSNLYQ